MMWGFWEEARVQKGSLTPEPTKKREKKLIKHTLKGGTRPGIKQDSFSMGASLKLRPPLQSFSSSSSSVFLKNVLGRLQDVKKKTHLLNKIKVILSLGLALLMLTSPHKSNLDQFPHQSCGGQLLLRPSELKWIHQIFCYWSKALAM